VSALVVAFNRLFRRPNVGGRESAEAYSAWEHRWGRELVQTYLEPAGDLDGKTVLDVGCGLGGKTVAYHEAGARMVAGTDILAGNIVSSREYAERHAPALKGAFFASDAADLPVAPSAFDTVVANDAMEHFARPEAALREMARVTRFGGAIWLFFTPHFSPLGSHLYDYVYTPWCHLLFSRGQLRGAVGRVLRERSPEAPESEIRERLDEIMTSYDRDLNHMSIRWFLRIIRSVGGLDVSYLELRPARFRALEWLTRVPLLRELVTGFVICRLERTAA